MRFGVQELELVVYWEFGPAFLGINAWDFVPLGLAQFPLAQPAFGMLILLGIDSQREWDASSE